ncbi:MAG TPA: VOC family protein [Geminicoccaceae bacterium]|nr:VOC family protein [Geminicoccus sp.]HMU49404.1 VOC family protein [Geminicoccaceae bacterium]
MQPLERVLETVLYVDDLAAAEAFYAGTLGLVVDARKPDVFVFFRLDGAMLLLFRAEATRVQGELPAHGAVGAGHMCFAVPEAGLDAWKARLRAGGVAIEHEQQWPRGGRSFYVRDPAGNSVELATPRIWGFPE